MLPTAIHKPIRNIYFLFVILYHHILYICDSCCWTETRNGTKGIKGLFPIWLSFPYSNVIEFGLENTHSKRHTRTVFEWWSGVQNAECTERKFRKWIGYIFAWLDVVAGKLIDVSKSHKHKGYFPLCWRKWIRVFHSLETKSFRFLVLLVELAFPFWNWFRCKLLGIQDKRTLTWSL